jgi:polysaccharide biosynthesis protein PslH
LLTNRSKAAALGRAARRLVVERMSWPAVLSRLPEIVGRNAAAESRDAA